MKINILTLFPKMFSGPFDESIIKRARDYGLVDIQTHQLRDWATDKHHTVDQHPYGGGVGMLMMVEPIYMALQDIRMLNDKWPMINGGEKKVGEVRKVVSERVVLLDAGGEKFTQKRAQEYAKLDHLILICGRYEGVDHRVHEHLVDDVISVGDFVVTGGELPAMLVTDAVTRLIPGVLEKDTATDFESFSLSPDPLTSNNQQLTTLLEYPQYTRPENFNGWKVPDILLTGDHKKIDEWRYQKAIEKTKKVRPDLLK